MSLVGPRCWSGRFWRKEKAFAPTRIWIPNHPDGGIDAIYTNHVTSVPEFHPRTGHEGWPWSLYPLDRKLVPTVQETGWAPVLFWSGAGNLVPITGFNPQTLQSVASRYTHYAGTANKTLIINYTEHIRCTGSKNPQVAYCSTCFKQLSWIWPCWWNYGAGKNFHRKGHKMNALENFQIVI
jgi:hypothetical protein